MSVADLLRRMKRVALATNLLLIVLFVLIQYLSSGSTSYALLGAAALIVNGCSCAIAVHGIGKLPGSSGDGS